MIDEGLISIDDPRRPDVRALLERHLTFSLEQTPPEHSFALDSRGLLGPTITFFSFRLAGELLGMGAIKRLSPEHAEIKSMHTAAAARGRGVGRAMLAHLLDVARARGYRQVSLETGTMEAFAPARALYESAGFTPCEPFGDYERTEDNYFMTLALDKPAEDISQEGLSKAPVWVHSVLRLTSAGVHSAHIGQGCAAERRPLSAPGLRPRQRPRLGVIPSRPHPAKGVIRRLVHPRER